MYVTMIGKNNDEVVTLRSAYVWRQQQQQQRSTDGQPPVTTIDVWWGEQAFDCGTPGGAFSADSYQHDELESAAGRWRLQLPMINFGPATHPTSAPTTAGRFAQIWSHNAFLSKAPACTPYLAQQDSALRHSVPRLESSP